MSSESGSNSGSGSDSQSDSSGPCGCSCTWFGFDTVGGLNWYLDPDNPACDKRHRYPDIGPGQSVTPCGISGTDADGISTSPNTGTLLPGNPPTSTPDRTWVTEIGCDGLITSAGEI